MSIYLNVKPIMEPYNWRDPKNNVYWDELRAKIARGEHVDKHKYRVDRQRLAAEHRAIARAILSQEG